MKKYKLIGLTGTTGSGKSCVCKIFEQKGYQVINADFLARKAVENPLVLSLLCEKFGEDIVQGDILNRKLLGARAFSSKESTAVLNSITHPFISALFIQELERLANEGCKKVVFDAPQLFESRLNVLCDVIVGVTADEPIRIKRITERDNISEGNAKKRIAVQYSKEFFENNCDYIIENNFSLEKLEKQTADIIYKLDK